MTVLLEAIVLPALLLTTALLGGLRVGTTVALVPPPLTSLVLGMVLVAALARAGVLRPERLMNIGRGPLENLSGFVVLAALFAASAQVLHLLIPDTGLLHVGFSVILFVQLLSTAASGTGRRGMLRSLVVLFGSLFVLRWIALEALYAAEGGTLKRVVTVLAEGMTLGALDYAPHAPATGYIALLALVLYMASLALLAPPPVETALAVPVRGLERAPGREIIGLVVLLVAAGGCRQAAAVSGEASGQEHALRAGALRSARVWSPPAVPVAQANLGENPAGEFRPADEVRCRFLVEEVGGTTSKFNCQLPGGDVLKVKYGSRNPEIHAEVAATRLLRALGFGADTMYAVRSVICEGCPPFPFQALKCQAALGLSSVCFAGGLDFTRARRFDNAVIERRLEGRKIEATEDQGWAWYELEAIDPSAGGAPRAEVDAFRLLAILLVHWDNKAANQRLVCLPGGNLPGGGCAAPLALMQDVGATFGPLKLDLANWRRIPVWKDPAQCLVSMRELPWSGGTYPDHQISEEGRRFLLDLLEQLTPTQLEALFVSSGATRHEQVAAESRNPRAWVKAFEDKVAQIRGAGPCPATGS